MKTFNQYVKDRNYKPDASFIQIHKEIFSLWRLWIKESSVSYYFKRL